MNVIRIESFEESPIKLTQHAVIAIKEFFLSEEVSGTGLRIFVNGGGCAGLQYGLDFSDIKDNDIVFFQDDIEIYIDCISAMHLEGTTVDYQMGMSGSGFKFENPSAKTTCGCGLSFN